MSTLADALIVELRRASAEQLAALAGILQPYLGVESPIAERPQASDSMLDSKAMAERLGKSERYVATLCRDGRLPGAFKPTGTKYWLIREADFDAAMTGRPAQAAPPSRARVYEAAPPRARPRFGKTAA